MESSSSSDEEVLSVDIECVQENFGHLQLMPAEFLAQLDPFRYQPCFGTFQYIFNRDDPLPETSGKNCLVAPFKKELGSDTVETSILHEKILYPTFHLLQENVTVHVVK